MPQSILSQYILENVGVCNGEYSSYFTYMAINRHIFIYGLYLTNSKVSPSQNQITLAWTVRADLLKASERIQSLTDHDNVH